MFVSGSRSCPFVLWTRGVMEGIQGSVNTELPAPELLTVELVMIEQDYADLGSVGLPSLDYSPFLLRSRWATEGSLGLSCNH